LLHVINSFIFFAEKLKSKFDDQSESESETKSVHMSDQEDDGYYLADTPPESPVELLPELPQTHISNSCIWETAFNFPD
jgi:hypothetical protein